MTRLWKVAIYAYLLMKERVAKEKDLHRRVRRIEEALTNSKKRT